MLMQSQLQKGDGNDINSVDYHGKQVSSCAVEETEQNKVEIFQLHTSWLN